MCNKAEEKKKDVIEVEKKIFEFYKRIVYGTNYSRKGISEITNIEQWCFYAAWKAMSQHTLHWENGKDEKGKFNKKKIVLDTYFAKKWPSINNNDGIKSLIKDINDFLSKKVKGTNNVKSFSYGLAQKLVNMFFKHLYTFKDYDKQIANFDFSVCDCPVDSITFERMAKDGYVHNGSSWSKLTENDYKEIQNKIQTIVENSKGEYKSRFDYEFGWE